MANLQENKLVRTLARGTVTLGVLAGAASVFAAGAANAQIIGEQMFMDTATLPDLGSLFVPQVVNLSLPKFDPLDGFRTLQMVTINFQQTWGGTGGAENRSESSASLTLRLGADIGIAGPGFSDPASITDVVAQTQPSPNSPFAATPFDGTSDFDGTSGFTDTFTQFMQEQMVAMLNAPDDDLSAYIGAGEFVDFTIDARSLSEATGAGDIDSFFRTNGSGKVSVVYKYEEIPEPFTILGAGTAVGFGAFFKRKLKQKAS